MGAAQLIIFWSSLVHRQLVEDGEQIVEESEEPELLETLYLQLTDSFTIQLRDSGSMMQVKLALRTPYGQPMVDEISAHEIGIRAALLETLSGVEGATASSENFQESNRARLARLC